MSPHTSRRQFLRSALAVPLMSAGCGFGIRAAESFERTGPPRLRIGLAAYSFRDDFKAGPEGAPARMDMFRFLDYCAAHDCDGAELTSYYFPEDLTDGYLARVRRHAHLCGVTISGTAVGNDFCHPPGPKRDAEIAGVKLWIQRAAMLGAPHIRVFAGGPHGQPLPVAKRLCIEALEECGDVAGRHGILLGLENHGGIVAEADDLVDIIRSVKSPWVGINLDTGNFHTADPYADLAKCAPYAVNVQFKGLMSRRGQRTPEPADYGGIFQIFKDARYQGWVILEYEMPEDPWERVPVMLAAMRAQC